MYAIRSYYEWPIALGDAVAKGQIVLVIESEKAEIEIEATAAAWSRRQSRKSSARLQTMNRW